MKDDDRYCADDEQWVCMACGKHVEKDKYEFDDVSCMLNSAKFKKSECKYEDDDPSKLVVKIEGDADDKNE